MLATRTYGVEITGGLGMRGLDVDGDINLDGGAITFSASSNTLDFADSVKANFGNSDDLQIYHDGTHSYINDAGTGNLKVLTTTLVVKNAADNETMLQLTQNGSVDLYYDNSKKLETTSSGVTITGSAKLTADDGLYIRSSTNGAGAKIKFSDHAGGSYAQNGTIQYKHSDGKCNNHWWQF